MKLMDKIANVVWVSAQIFMIVTLLTVMLVGMYTD